MKTRSDFPAPLDVYSTDIQELLPLEADSAEQSEIRKSTFLISLNPAIGIGGVILGTLGAIWAVPNDIYSAGALFVPALILTCGLLLGPAISCMKTLRTLQRAETILVLSPIYWLLLDLLQGLYPMGGVSSEAISHALAGIGLFVTGSYIALLSRPWRFPAFIRYSASHSLRSDTLYKLVWVFFVLAFIRFAIPSGFNPTVMWRGVMASRWASPWARPELGGWDSFLDQLSYFGYVLPPLTMQMVKRRGIFDLKVMVAFILTFIISAFLIQSGSRRVIGVTLGSAMLCWVIESPKFNVRKVVSLFLSIITLLVLLQFMLQSRGTGFKSDSIFSSNDDPAVIRVDDNFLRLAQVTELVPRWYSYVYQKFIVFILVRPVPRILWPGKPVDPGFNLAEALGQKGVSLSCSVIGELFFSGGWIAVFLGGLLYGKLASSIGGFLRFQGSSANLVYALSVMALFAGMRSMVDLVLMNYALISWAAVSWFFLRARGAK